MSILYTYDCILKKKKNTYYDCNRNHLNQNFIKTTVCNLYALAQ